VGLTLSGALPAAAAPVTPSAVSNAVLRAAAGQAASATRSRRAVSATAPAIAQITPLTNRGDRVGYVAQLKPAGYWLMAGDDRLPPWKLRSDAGSFAQLPPGLVKVLALEMAEDLHTLSNLVKAGAAPDAKYQKQWQALLSSTQTPAQALTAAEGDTLSWTSWGQGYPYNNYCPVVDADTGDRAPAGCVACAMAQILRYYAQPAAVRQDHSYTDSREDMHGTYAMHDAGLGAYDWGNMGASLDSGSSEAQQQAVSRLMFHCAVAVDSNFETDSTGASPSRIPAALQTYFGYSCGGLSAKSDYTSAQWYSKIAADIKAARPIFYGMYAEDGKSDGHATVCDGFQNGNEIHLNLGWRGYDTAWYNIDSISAEGYTWTVHYAVFAITSPAGKPLNTPPVFADLIPGTNLTVDAGGTVEADCSATDSDYPYQTVTYTLQSGPTNATFDTNDGYFSWQPTAEQADTTNRVVVVVTDDGSPPAKATNFFFAIVNPQPPTSTVLKSFGSDQDSSSARPLAYYNGALYWAVGGAGGGIFRLGTNGSDDTLLADLPALAGAGNPSALLLSGDTLYAVSTNGGSAGLGCLFSLGTKGGKAAILQDFTGANGALPLPNLVLSQGLLLGLTAYGGPAYGSANPGAGVMYSLSNNGGGFRLTRPFTNGAGVILAAPDPAAPAGDLYGIYRSSSTGEMLYRIHPDGTGFTKLLNLSNNFAITDLILSGGSLFGASYDSTPGSGDGTVFRVDLRTRSGTPVFTTLTNFTGSGYAHPRALLAAGNTLYAVADTANSDGIVFRLGTDGTGFRVIKTLDYWSEGGAPRSLIYVCGSLFGTTAEGGSTGGGAVYRLDLPTETVPPTVTITSPARGQRITNNTAIVGAAKDSRGVAQVWVSANSNGWVAATSTNLWTNWSASVALSGGDNTLLAYAVDVFGNLSTNALSKCFCVRAAPAVLRVSGAGTVAGLTNGQNLALGSSYSVTATAAKGSVFSNWTDDAGIVLTNGARLAFAMRSNLVLVANFVTNPFPAAAGHYTGLFTNINGAALPGSGFITATADANGMFSGSVRQGASTFSLAGRLAVNGGLATNLTLKSGRLAFSLSLALDGTGVLSGQIAASNWTATLLAYRNVFSKTNPAAQATNAYTLILAPGEGALEPGGAGYGTVRVEANGTVTFAGALGDGVKVTQSATFSPRGEWPFYLAPYSGGGALAGWLRFTNAADRDIDGTLAWTKSAKVSEAFYRAGFTNLVEAAGSAYASAAGHRCLALTNAVLSLQAANLVSNLSFAVELKTNNTAAGAGVKSFAITGATGLLNGAAINPASGKLIQFKGAVLRKQNAAYGQFPSTNQTGLIQLRQP
jgi:hypothetical protein